MARLYLLLLVLLVLLVPFRGKAVELLVSGSASYNTTAPTSSDIANWNTGWGSTGISGWDYVGQVNGASGVYLRNGWVITAGHVGAGTFTLGGVAYSVVAGSAQSILQTSGTYADLTLFQIAALPNLPALTISGNAPFAFSQSKSGSPVAMIGYGGGLGETWGYNTVTAINQAVGVNSFVTTDFSTAYGTTSYGNGHNIVSVTNNYTFVVGDSGGGDFIYNSTTSSWNLAGLNEAVDTQTNDAYMVELSAYSSQINTITAVPEPSTYVLLGLGLGATAVLRRRLRR